MPKLGDTFGGAFSAFERSVKAWDSGFRASFEKVKAVVPLLASYLHRLKAVSTA